MIIYHLWPASFCHTVLIAVWTISICSTIAFVLHSNTSDNCKPHQATYCCHHFNCFLITSHSSHISNTPHIIHPSSPSTISCISTNSNTPHTYTLMCSRNGRQSFPNTRSLPLFIHKNLQFLCLFGHLRTHQIIRIKTATDIRESILQELVFSTLRLRVFLHIATRNASMRLLIHHS